MPPRPIMPRRMRSFAPTTRADERAVIPGRMVFSLFASAALAAPRAAAAAEARFKNARLLDGVGFCGIGQISFQNESRAPSWIVRGLLPVPVILPKSALL